MFIFKIINYILDTHCYLINLERPNTFNYYEKVVYVSCNFIGVINMYPLYIIIFFYLLIFGAIDSKLASCDA